MPIFANVDWSLFITTRRGVADRHLSAAIRATGSRTNLAPDGLPRQPLRTLSCHAGRQRHRRSEALSSNNQPGDRATMPLLTTGAPDTALRRAPFVSNVYSDTMWRRDISNSLLETGQYQFRVVSDFG
jgi:hypothetical protein